MQLAGRRLFDCLQSILLFLCLILPFKLIIIVIHAVDVLGHKHVFGPSQTHFNPRCARAKLMPANINSIVIIIAIIFKTVYSA